MMKKYIVLTILLSGLFMQWSCSDDDNVQVVIPDVTEDIEVQDFIWQGLNLYYLWQESVPNLNDTKIDDQTEYVNFLKATPDQEEFFENLIYNRSSVDFWSWIVDDYIELENSFAGISKNNGVDFRLSRFSGSNDVFGYVRLILPDSDASDKNIKRGDLFTSVNGTQLNLDNYRDLLFNDDVDTYTLGLSKIEDGVVSPTGVSVTLTKSEYTENPVFITKTIDEDGHKIGYIMYNSFTANFDNELNDAFLQLKNEGITDLILDFRYNPGGRGSSARAMASMITGQFKGEIFDKVRFNSKLQTEFENSNPDWLFDNFSDKMSNGNTINSLNLSSVHIIITSSSASASELVINGLNPYINVRLVGEQSAGKYTGSFTLYDSDNFNKTGANPNHRYALQPIVLEGVNKLDENDKDGFEPHIEIPEELDNLGVLGEDNEPLLRAAINDIIGVSAKHIRTKAYSFEKVTDSRMHTLLKDNMFFENKELNKLFKRTQIKIK
ncbi:MAG: S41 family peptidase [Flavobacteriaceae bacterium]|nr:S41 family peptidase [Flavobacteriaceae bacterium]